MTARPDDLLFFTFGSVVSDAGRGVRQRDQPPSRQLAEGSLCSGANYRGHDCADVRGALVRISLAVVSKNVLQLRRP